MYFSILATTICWQMPLSLENMADLARVQGIKVGITTDNHIWLLNKIGNGTTLDISAGEIFGFNIGSYSEVPLGEVYGETKRSEYTQHHAAVSLSVHMDNNICNPLVE